MSFADVYPAHEWWLQARRRLWVVSTFKTTDLMSTGVTSALKLLSIVIEVEASCLSRLERESNGRYQWVMWHKF